MPRRSLCQSVGVGDQPESKRPDIAPWTPGPSRALVSAGFPWAMPIGHGSDSTQAPGSGASWASGSRGNQLKRAPGSFPGIDPGTGRAPVQSAVPGLRPKEQGSGTERGSRPQREQPSPKAEGNSVESVRGPTPAAVRTSKPSVQHTAGQDSVRACHPALRGVPLMVQGSSRLPGHSSLACSQHRQAGQPSPV